MPLQLFPSNLQEPVEPPRPAKFLKFDSRFESGNLAEARLVRAMSVCLLAEHVLGVQVWEESGKSQVYELLMSVDSNTVPLCC